MQDLKKIRILRNIIRNLLLGGKYKETKQLMMSDSILPFFREEFLPKSSSLLVNKFISDILTLEYNLRNLVIISHLYFENIADELIKDDFPKPQALDNFSFYQKVKIIEARAILDYSIIEFLLYINKIRNKFAHDLDYEMPDSDILEISFFKKVAKRFPYKVKRYRMRRNYYMWVVECIHNILKIVEQYPDISKIKKNMKRKYCGR